MELCEPKGRDKVNVTKPRRPLAGQGQGGRQLLGSPSFPPSLSPFPTSSLPPPFYYLTTVGKAVGVEVGAAVGAAVGLAVGVAVGAADGVTVGAGVGLGVSRGSMVS